MNLQNETSLIEVKQQQEKSLEKQLMCPFCREVFTNESNLQSHLIVHCRECYKCQICLKEFRLKRDFNEHMKTHIGKKEKEKDMQLICPFCNEVSANETELQNHLLIHYNEQQYKCIICSKKFSYKSVLNVHTRTHTKEQPFECPTCHRKFTNRSGFNYHLLSHKRKHECNECNKTFVLKQDLNRHFKINHMREKHFTCDTCQKGFARRNSLINHLAIHSGDRPFSCLLCQKSFALKSTLKNHLKVHSRELKGILPLKEKSESKGILLLKEESESKGKLSLKEESESKGKLSLKEESESKGKLSLKEESESKSNLQHNHLLNEGSGLITIDLIPHFSTGHEVTVKREPEDDYSPASINSFDNLITKQEEDIS